MLDHPAIDPLLRWGSRARALLARTIRGFTEDRAPLFAAAMAFYAFLSIAPMVLLLAYFVELLLGTESGQALVVEAMAPLLGDEVKRIIENLVARTGSAGSFGPSWAPTLGIGVMIYAAARGFMGLQESLNAIWNVEPQRRSELRGKVALLLRKRALTFAMLLVVGVLLSVQLLAFVTLEAIARWGDLHWIGHAWVKPVQALAGVALTTVLFATIYRMLPDVRIAWSDVWFGAAGTALLVTVGSAATSAYLRVSGGSVYGAAGSLAVLLVWLYYSAYVFFFGAEFTQAWAESRGHIAVPEAYARSVRRDAGGELRGDDG